MSTMTRTIVILALFVFVVVSVVPGTIGDSGSRCRNCLKTINENVLHVSDALDHVNTRLDALSKCHQTGKKNLKHTSPRTFAYKMLTHSSCNLTSHLSVSLNGG